MRDDEAPTLDVQRPGRVSRIVALARAAAPDERRGIVERECAEDPELRRAVESVLRDAPTDDGDVPREIGPYRLLEPIGEGGMGSVWLAEQREPIERRVAIKLIRGDFRGQALHRFEVERNTLARMDHPAIAQVFEAGDDARGRPYLAMEYVDGSPIDEWCDVRRLPITTRLRLFVQVCRGVHHAHQKGVLHRDLKPQNVLVSEVDGEARPRIIDFGIARWLDDERDLRLTRRGTVVGTPAYLSPEAVIGPEGDAIDIRSDVYSLGVLLHRLLVSELPFDVEDETFVSLLRRIADEDPAPPSQRFRRLPPEEREAIAERRGESVRSLVRRLRGDLDGIVLCALQKDRDRRYGSAADLAADIERHLDLRPIEAGRPGRLYRARTFVRRHRAGVFAVTLLVLSLAGGLVARTLEARRADREASKALRAEAEAREVIDFLVGLFELSDPGRSLGESVTARELLDRGADRLRTGLDDQPAARARLLDTIGVVYERLGLYEPAEEILEEALALRTELPVDPLERAETFAHLGQVHWQRGQTARARELFDEALAIREKELGPDHLLVAEILDDLGMVAELDARWAEAEELLRRGLEIRRARAGEVSEEAADSLSHLGILEQDRGDSEAAEPLFREALRIREEILPADHPEIARSLNGLALAVYSNDRPEEALELHRRALRIRERAFGSVHTEVAQTLNNLGNLLVQLGREEEAMPLQRRAVEIYEETLGPTNPRTGIALFNLGDAEWSAGRTAEAEALLRRALRAFEERGPDHPHVAVGADRLADLLAATGRLGEAESLYRRALAIRFAGSGPGSPPLVDTAGDLAALLRRTGREDEARDLELRAGVE